MPAPDFEDLAEFFDPEEFAETAELLRDGSVFGRVLCIFEDPTGSASVGQFEVDRSVPTLVMPAASAAGIARRDQARVKGRLFDILDLPDLDGTGMAIVSLSEIPASA